MDFKNNCLSSKIGGIPFGGILSSKIPKQLSPALRQMEDSASQVNQGFKWMFLIAFCLNLIFSGAMKYMLIFIRSLQMILHLPMLRTIFPAHVILVISTIFPLAGFDVLDNDYVNMSTLFKYDE